MASPKITHIGLVDPTLDPLNTRAVSTDPATTWEVTVWIVSAVIGGLGSLLAVWIAFRHSAVWHHPKVQVYYLRLLLFVPALFSSSFLTLLFPLTNSTFVFVRHCVMAGILYTYLELMHAVLAPHFTQRSRQLRVIEILDALKVSSKLDFGRSVSAVSYYSSSIHLPSHLFMVIGPLLALIGQFLSSYGYWGYCSSESSHLWFPITVAVTAVALYAWIAVYRLVHSLQAVLIRPRRQFVVFTGLFLTLTVQEFVIGVVAKCGVLPALFDLPSPSRAGITLMNWIVCMECLPFACALWYAFHWEPFVSMRKLRHTEVWVDKDVAIPDPGAAFLESAPSGARSVISVGSDRRDDVASLTDPVVVDHDVLGEALSAIISDGQPEKYLSPVRTVRPVTPPGLPTFSGTPRSQASYYSPAPRFRRSPSR